MTNNHHPKITDEQFLEALTECNGLFTPTARYIERKYNIKYSRHAVHDRAQNFQEELMQIRQSVLDHAEGRLISCIKDESCDLKLNIRIAKYFLDALGKDRGYGKNGVDKTLAPKPEEGFEIDGKFIRFE